MPDTTNTTETDGRGLALTKDRHLVEARDVDGFALYEERPDEQIKLNGFAVRYNDTMTPTVVRVVPGSFQIRLVNVETRNVEEVLNCDPNNILGIVAAERIDL